MADGDISSASEEYFTSGLDSSVSSGDLFSDESISSTDDETSITGSESEDDIDQTLSSVQHMQPDFLRPIYEGANIAVVDSYLLMFQYSLKHSLTKKAFEELLKLVALYTSRAMKPPRFIS